MSKVPHVFRVLGNDFGDGPEYGSCNCNPGNVVRKNDVYETLKAVFPFCVQKGRRILGYTEQEKGAKMEPKFELQVDPENRWHMPYSDWSVGKVCVVGGVDFKRYVHEFGKKEFLNIFEEGMKKHNLELLKLEDGCFCSRYYLVKSLKKEGSLVKKEYLENIKRAISELDFFEKKIEGRFKQKYSLSKRGRSNTSKLKAFLEQKTLDEL